MSTQHVWNLIDDVAMDIDTARANRRRVQTRLRMQRVRAAMSVDDAATDRTRNTAAKRRKRAGRRTCTSPVSEHNDDAVQGGENWWLALPSSVPPIYLQWDRKCDICGVLRDEPRNSKCFVCGPDGAHYLPPLPNYPEEWNVFLRSAKLGAVSRAFNNTFSLTALGVDNGRFLRPDEGPFAVTLKGGRTYHRIMPSTEEEHAIRWFLYEPASLMSNATDQHIRRNWVEAALAGLRRVNPYVNTLERLAIEGPDNVDLAVCIEHPERVDANELAAIVSIAPAGLPTPRRYVIKYQGDDEHHFLSSTSPLIEPLHYLLLLPEGTLGWSVGLQTVGPPPEEGRPSTHVPRKFSQRRFYRSRFFINAEQMCIFTKLAGEWLVDAQSSIEESTLMYIRHNQHERDDDIADRDNDADPTGDVRLPSSFMHSPAWSRANVSDCLALCHALGPINLFTTYTSNPNWPEIKSQLRPGQQASDRPDVLARVFNRRYSKMKSLMKKWFGPERWSTRTQEFQKRSLPHMHELIALKYIPRTAEDLACFLRGDVPSEPGRLRDLVLKHMMHDHNKKRMFSRCGYPDKRCSYNYPKPLNPTPYIDERGRYIPARYTEDDRWVVQYCPAVLLAWEGHVNMEWGGSASLFAYLFKYLFKGLDEVNFTIARPLADPTARQPVDEIKDYQKGRWLSSVEAATRIAGFHISEKSPGVTRLAIHLPGEQRGRMGNSRIANASASLLMRYLDRPAHPALDTVTYMRFGELCYTIPHRQEDPMHERDILETWFPDRTQMRLRLYADTHVGVARMQMVYPRQGDLYYLRAILSHRPASSFVDARTFNDVVYATYQEAAMAMGLFHDNNEGEVAFRELLDVNVSPHQLRWFFCILAVDGHPVLSIWDEHKHRLGLDIEDRYLRTRQLFTPAIIERDVLIQLQDILAGMGRQLSDIGLPEPEPSTAEVDRERAMWWDDPGDLHSFYDSLTDEQLEVYNGIMDELDAAEPRPIHVDGPAGRGKTFVLYPVIGALRKRGFIALISASSAFAAKNYPGGKTGHYLYGIPVDEFTPYLTSKVSPQSDRASLLRIATIHIHDEISALHFKAFDCADRLMRTLMGCNRVWGGRPLVTVGDFRQTAPVERNAGRQVIVAASLRTQPVFKNFKILRLKTSMRQANDPEFSDWLDKLGEDYENEQVDLARFTHTVSISELIDFVFPEDVLDDPAECMRRAILSPYNDAVREFNDNILERLPGDSAVYYSTDTLEDDGGVVSVEDNPLATDEFLNEQNEPGIPRHLLHLKVGSICRFLRNFSPAKGITKNTRVIVTRLFQHSVEVATLPSTVAGQELESITIHVPRIDFEFFPRYSKFKVRRKQLPLMLSYAVSFNGCQGLTCLRLGIDLRRDVFSHGQLYCAMSRVPNSTDVLILKHRENFSTWTRNIVWKELLLDPED